MIKNELEKNYIIELLKCAINNSTPSNPSKDLDWDVVFEYAKKHRIIPVLYFSIQKLPDECKSDITNLKHYELAYKSNLVDDANRENEISIISKELSKNNIDYIFLKGTVTKHFYLDTSMRMMSDIDVLYRNKTAKEIKKLFESIEYTQTKSTPKDTMYLSPNQLVKVEMQQSLIDDGFTDWLEYLDTIWDRCEQKSENEYTMSPEDFYVYHIIHMAKHFINGGIGLRHMLDTWVIKNHFKKMDLEYIKLILTKLKLNKFEKQIDNTCKYWFVGRIPSNIESTNLLAEYIFANGAFGNIPQQYVNESSAGMKGKLFPSKEKMANYYGETVIKHPVTIPFYWVRLNIKRLFKNPIKTKNKIISISNVPEQQKEKTNKLFDICGLN